MFGRKQEEFAADFCLVSRRLLSDFEYRIFRYYFLLAAGSKLCSDYFGLDRGHFYHVLYTIEHKLGRGFAELEPYALFPLDEYFGGSVRKGPPMAVDVRPARKRRRKPAPVNLPLSA
jgi:hypothetical protein